MLQNPCTTLGFEKNMVYEIPPGRRLTISSQWPNRYCLHGLINSYHNFLLINPIHPLHTVKMTAMGLRQFFPIWLLYKLRYFLHGRINSYHSFWLFYPILYLHNVNILNICIKQFGAKMTAMKT